MPLQQAARPANGGDPALRRNAGPGQDDDVGDRAPYRVLSRCAADRKRGVAHPGVRYPAQKRGPASLPAPLSPGSAPPSGVAPVRSGAPSGGESPAGASARNGAAPHRAIQSRASHSGLMPPAGRERPASDMSGHRRTGSTHPKARRPIATMTLRDARPNDARRENPVAHASLVQHASSASGRRHREPRPRRPISGRCRPSGGAIVPIPSPVSRDPGKPRRDPLARAIATISRIGRSGRSRSPHRLETIRRPAHNHL